jgi:hypothetical protein
MKNSAIENSGAGADDALALDGAERRRTIAKPTGDSL